MPNYRRRYIAGGTYFFTLVTHRRRPILDSTMARQSLFEAIAKVRKNHDFVTEELVILPNHLHMIMTLPPGDANFSLRLSNIKSNFTRLYLAGGGVETEQSAGRDDARYRGVWQARFWEHHLRDLNDVGECRKYCWYNPVKHGLVRCPHDWPASTFHDAVEKGWLDRTWCCSCNGPFAPIRIAAIAGAEMD